MGKDGVDKFPTLPGDKKVSPAWFLQRGSVYTCQAVQQQLTRPHDKAQTPM